MTVTTALFSQITTMLGAEKVTNSQIIQPLWGGYGKLFRVFLRGYSSPSVIVKYVQYPNQPQHPRGWNTLMSHQRKLTSYEVESRWYQDFAQLCSEDCKVPTFIAVEQDQNSMLLIMEDLKTLGLSKTFRSVPPTSDAHFISAMQIRAGLSWLAHFHAEHLQRAATGLWPTGGYWHLQTRPDEHVAMIDSELKSAAEELDFQLKNCRYNTLIHGDAKAANFCFDVTGSQIAAVDFQYVGTGCGIKDVVIFLCSTLPYQQCQAKVPALLNEYFAILTTALKNKLSNDEIAELEQEWRQLYPVAWADYLRFMQGWNPDNWKINSYTEAMAEQGLKQLSLSIA